MSNYISLANICRVVRGTLELTQKELGEMIGTNQTEISFIERGFIPDDADKIKKILDIYYAYE